MTIETVPGTPDLRYYLIGFDKHGRERGDDPDARDGWLSHTVAELLAAEPITDVFFMSHGWQGDVPAAKRQYDKWIPAMLGCVGDIDALKARPRGFRPLLIGIHWPSLPWGNEDPSASAASFAPGEAIPLDAWVSEAADTLADTERARAALATVFRSALEDAAPDELPPEVLDAYRVLQEEAGQDAQGAEGAPGADIDGFDPEAIYQEAMEREGAFGGGVQGAVLAPLRQLSFWQMKARGRSVGESGAAELLRRLMTQATGRDVRFHLMGHSFGCIVVSAAVDGPQGAAALPRPVHSMLLAQGALSLWSYCPDIPVAPGRPGYFHRLVGDGKVACPIVTTQSVHDTAVRVFYPLGAGLAGQIDYAPGKLPKYGGVGVFGIQGLPERAEDRDMLAADADYGFRPGHIYNLNAEKYIREGGGAVGAHNDIAKPEVAHAFWQAVGTDLD